MTESRKGTEPKLPLDAGVDSGGVQPMAKDFVARLTYETACLRPAMKMATSKFESDKSWHVLVRSGDLDILR